MKICVIGQGYIGLPTAMLFAKNGCDVVGVDVNDEVVNNLNDGKIHIEEKGMNEILKEIINNNYKASLTPEQADVFIITVPTPAKMEDLSCDLSYVHAACLSIIPVLEKRNTVIVESTIAPMSMDNFIKPIFEEANFKIGEDLFLAHCPERVLPGKIIYELINNDRIVGGITPKCTQKAVEVYKIFVKGEIAKTEAKTAEMSKCMENTFRDVNIALANELTKICQKINVNALDVIELANKHPRVNIHSPGPGVGGHCLAIDPYFIYALAPEQAKIIKLARDTNNSMPEFVVDNLKNIIKNENIKENNIKENNIKENNIKENNIKIAILGIAYKGNTDDIRESPALKIIKLLENDGYDLSIYDPHIENENIKNSYCLKDNLEEAIENANIALILSDHNEFKNLDYDLMENLMENPVIFDTKNIVKNDPNNKVKIINFGNLSR